MKITRIKIDGYKQLKHVELNMENNIRDDDHLKVNFFIGENGSGKSTLLEAIAIIFTNTIANQEVGFEFEVEYIIKELTDQKVFVKIKNEASNKHKFVFSYFTKMNSEDEYEVADETIEKFSDRNDLHPDRILTVGSGSHNNFDEALINRPIEKIVESLKLSNKETNNTLSYEKYEDLLFNPKVLNFDTNSLVYILIIIFNFKNIDKNIEGEDGIDHLEEDEKEDESEEVKQAKIRARMFYSHFAILNQSVNNLLNKGFSLTIDKNIKEKFKGEIDGKNNISEYPIIFFKSLDNLLTKLNPGVIDNEKTTHYYFTSLNDSLHDNPIDDNPLDDALDILTTLMIANRLGIIIDATLYLNHNNEKLIVSEKSLSDGEWLWLSKMGLIILSQLSLENDFLIIFDEPDVFLNELWIKEFVSKMNIFSGYINLNPSEEEVTYKTHEYFISTHSTFMLTDAWNDQVYRFQKSEGEINIERLPFSTFGADIGYISVQLNNKRTGDFSSDKIMEAFSTSDLTRIDSLLEALGRGYDRFLIRERRIEVEKDKLRKG